MKTMRSSIGYGMEVLFSLRKYADKVCTCVGGISIILAIIQRHQEYRTFQGCGYLILGDLAKTGDGYRDIIKRTILTAMGYHREDSLVLKSGCLALEQLGSSEKYGVLSQESLRNCERYC